MFDKTSKVFIFNICCFNTTSVVLMLQLYCIDVTRSDDPQPSYCVSSTFKMAAARPPSWIFILSRYLTKIQICTYFYAHMQNLVKIGRSAAELLRILNFTNGSRPSSSI